MSDIGLEEFKRIILAEPPDQIVRNILFNGVPYVFREEPNISDEVKEHLSNRLAVAVDKIFMVGSGKMGFSLSPDAFPRSFTPFSDLDIILVNEKLFDLVWMTVLQWHYPRKYSGLTAEDSKWMSEMRKQLYWGFCCPEKIDYKEISQSQILQPLKKLSLDWFDAFRTLPSHPQIRGRAVNSRLYRTIDHAVAYHVNGLLLVKEVVIKMGA